MNWLRKLLSCLTIPEPKGWTLTLYFDETDWATVKKEIEWRRGNVQPDSNSDSIATMFAEMVRDLNDYRDLYDREHPKDLPVDRPQENK